MAAVEVSPSNAGAPSRRIESPIAAGSATSSHATTHGPIAHDRS